MHPAARSPVRDVALGLARMTGPAEAGHPALLLHDPQDRVQAWAGSRALPAARRDWRRGLSRRPARAGSRGGALPGLQVMRYLPQPMPRLLLHGVPAFSAADAGPAQPLSARDALLLAWLHLEGPSPRSQLAGRLWPQGDEARARSNLRQLLLRLKRAVGEVLVETEGLLALAPGVEVEEGGGRLLGPLEFDDLPEMAAWLQTRREAQRRQQTREGLARAREALAETRLDAALAHADAVLAADRAVEEAHRLRMAVFRARGDRAAALQAWDDCREALRQELGIAPSTATQALGHAILADEAPVVAPQARGTTPVPPSAASPGAGASPPAAMADALRRPLPLVGRDAVRQQALAALSAGRGVLVQGEAGLGKTRLLWTLATGRTVLHCAGRPGDVLVPGALAARLLAEALGRFDLPLDAALRADVQRLASSGGTAAHAVASEAEHRRVLDVLGLVLAASARCGLRLVVLDDLHHADALSIEALARAWGHGLFGTDADDGTRPGDEEDGSPATPRLLALLACRRAELGSAARQLLDTLEGSGRLHRVVLQPLGVDELARLLAALPLGAALQPRAAELAAVLHGRVGGNPAFVLEALRALAQQPLAAGALARLEGLAWPVLREQLGHRLARLAPEALQLAQLAAVAQREFSLPLAAAALGRAPLALAPLFAELESAHVFSQGGFAHDLVAEAVSASLPAALRAPLHRLVAEHLQRGGGAGAEPAAIAHHLEAAGDVAEAAAWWLQAGHRALRHWRLDEATQHFDRAAPGLLGAGRRAEALQAMHGAARTLAMRSAMDASEARLAEAWPWARTDVERVQLLAVRVPSALGRQRPAEVRAGVEALLALLAAPGWRAELLPPDDHVRAWFAIAWGARVTRLAHAAQVLLTQAVAALPGAPAEQAKVLPFLQLAQGVLAVWQGRPAVAVALLRGALPPVAAMQQHGWVFNAAVALARAALGVGDALVLDEALGWMEQALEEGGLGEGFRVDHGQALAMRHLAHRQPELALRACDRARQRLRALDRGPRVQLESLAASAHLALGQPEAAWAGLQALPPGDGGPDVDEACRHWVHVRCLHRLGQPLDDALALAKASDPGCLESQLSLEHRVLRVLVGADLPVALSPGELAGRAPLLAGLAPAQDAKTLADPWLGP